MDENTDDSSMDKEQPPQERKERKLKCFHLFNCDKTYKLDIVEKLLDAIKEKVTSFDISTATKKSFRLFEMSEFVNLNLKKLVKSMLFSLPSRRLMTSLLNPPKRMQEKNIPYLNRELLPPTLKAKAENRCHLGKDSDICRDQSDISIIEDVCGDETMSIVPIFSGSDAAKTMKEEQFQHKPAGTPYENLLRTARETVDKKVVIIICNDKGNVSHNEEDAITDRIKQLLGDKGVILWWKGNKTFTSSNEAKFPTRVASIKISFRKKRDGSRSVNQDPCHRWKERLFFQR
ncbi:hypothetical protein OS493_031752 [Desmophyllum pertusum]|uniref:Uncharacterized protein n=1 Tax=Desmophyllum pertusum TaxID=174260 RepID=A0A9X0CXB1_9CNID|nr:hypothetical protein OS493_031752 [Desmophyllum pertusum]